MGTREGDWDTREQQQQKKMEGEEDAIEATQQQTISNRRGCEFVAIIIVVIIYSRDEDGSNKKTRIKSLAAKEEGWSRVGGEAYYCSGICFCDLPALIISSTSSS